MFCFLCRHQKVIATSSCLTKRDTATVISWLSRGYMYFIQSAAEKDSIGLWYFKRATECSWLKSGYFAIYIHYTTVTFRTFVLHSNFLNKMSFYFQSREYMDQRIDHGSNYVSGTFLGGIDAFIQFACNQAECLWRSPSEYSRSTRRHCATLHAGIYIRDGYSRTISR